MITVTVERSGASNGLLDVLQSSPLRQRLESTTAQFGVTLNGVGETMVTASVPVVSAGAEPVTRPSLC